jgi:hypothetical protein
MDVKDALADGHRIVIQIVEGLPESEWETTGVCGVWSVKDIIAHLASFEHLLVEVLSLFLGGGPTPCLDMIREDILAFNTVQVDMRKNNSWVEVLAEYKDTHEKAVALIDEIPHEMRRHPERTILWYGADDHLEEFIIYMNYAHKREHAAQIGVFCDQLRTIA